MKRQKIQFRQLIENVLNGWWGATELNVFQWILQTGKPLDTRTGGIHSVLYNYSANNHNSFTGFFRGSFAYREGYTNPNHTLLVAFSNAFVIRANDYTVLAKWRKKERVSLDSYRMLSFPDDVPEKRSDDDRTASFDIRWEIWRLSTFKGAKLRKEKCHPDYPDRIDPFIKSIDFSAFAEGWEIRLEFTFGGKDFERNGWNYSFGQKKGESVERFFWRVNRQIESDWLLKEVESGETENRNNEN